VQLELETLVRLAAALFFSGILGWERETLGKPAGLRTHMLVGGGAALFVGLGEFLVIEFQHYGELLRFDPTRIIEAVVAGVGFLGAGTIFFARRERTVQGLTTAASLWTTAAVGMAAGLGRYVLAAGATAMIFVVLRCLFWFEAKTARKPAKDER
jgi:putative Mg2+ transporter-C (MgtC) family protein